jgi:mRNA interferase MazF
VVISTTIGDIDRAVITVVPHTTTLRGTAYEAQVETFFLKRGAFDGQGLQLVPVTRAERILGVLNDEQMQQVERVVCKWLDLPCHR